MVPCAFHFKEIQSAFCLDIENGTEFFNQILNTHHCVKCVHIRSYSGLYFPAFALNTEIRYSVRMRESTYQNNSKYGHFLRSASNC